MALFRFRTATAHGRAFATPSPGTGPAGKLRTTTLTASYALCPTDPTRFQPNAIELVADHLP